jgi:hypothetical protein
LTSWDDVVHGVTVFVLIPAFKTVVLVDPSTALMKNWVLTQLYNDVFYPSFMMYYELLISDSIV